MLLVHNGEDALRVHLRVEGGRFEIGAELTDEDVRASIQPTRIGINTLGAVTRARIEVTITPSDPG